MDTRLGRMSAMTVSPAPSQDGSYYSYSSRETTPHPEMQSSFVPIDIPISEFQLGSHLTMPEPIKLDLHSQRISPHEFVELQPAPSQVSSGIHLAVPSTNVTSPQVTWTPATNGTQFTFAGMLPSSAQYSNAQLASVSALGSLPTLSAMEESDDSSSSSMERPNKMRKVDKSGADDRSKPKRKRIISKPQRTAANHRERRRMVTLNDAFDILKERIPRFSHEKKLSRIETLRLAIAYISFMTQLVNGKDPHDVTINLPFDMPAQLDQLKEFAYAPHPEAAHATGHNQGMPLDMSSFGFDLSQHGNPHIFYS